MAFVHRSALFDVQYQAYWQNDSQQDEEIAWVDDVRDSMSPFTSGAYVNYIDRNLSDGQLLTTGQISAGSWKSRPGTSQRTSSMRLRQFPSPLHEKVAFPGTKGKIGATWATHANEQTGQQGATMNDEIRNALAHDRTIDITTTGRKSNRPHRIETWLFRANGKHYLTGSPGRRDWYANLLQTPDFTLHLKESVQADLPARATPITDPEARRAIFTTLLGELDALPDLNAWLAGSPLMELEFKGEANGAYVGPAASSGDQRLAATWRLTSRSASKTPSP